MKRGHLEAEDLVAFDGLLLLDVVAILVLLLLLLVLLFLLLVLILAKMFQLRVDACFTSWSRKWVAATSARGRCFASHGVFRRGDAGRERHLLRASLLLDGNQVWAFVIVVQLDGLGSGILLLSIEARKLTFEGAARRLETVRLLRG